MAKKKKREKPESVAWNEEQGYIANILPYASNVGAPVIRPEDNKTWKMRGIAKVNHQLSAKFQELKKEYQKLIEEYKWNDLVYNATYNFEPVIGETYHLYSKDNGDIFLSLIEPSQWKMHYIGSFLLESSQKWVKV